MELSSRTRVGRLLVAYPFLLDFLADYRPQFGILRNPVMRNTAGRFATLGRVAALGQVGVERLMRDVAAEVKRQAGDDLAIDATTTEPGDDDKLETMRDIIARLHAGESVEAVKARFDELVKDAGPGEIAAMEQRLMAGGVDAGQVQRLCDVHVAVFRETLDQEPVPDQPSGHPVNTFMAENRLLESICADLKKALEEGSADRTVPLLESLSGVELHYRRKENQLFPYLERHGITGPPKVMWGVHDEIRARLKRALAAGGDPARLRESVPALITAVADMVYKEERILFPMALSTLSEEEWRAVSAGEAEIGFMPGVQPGTAWPEGGGAAEAAGYRIGALPLHTGSLPLEMIDLMLTHLPVDLSLVDQHDEVVYYSEGPERIFPRSPGVIGRKVQNCHPPKSVDTVERILAAFRAGRRDAAEFWIELGGRFLYIRYFALRDKAGAYRGCLEVSQDVTGIRALQGERRLLNWEEEV